MFPGTFRSFGAQVIKVRPGVYKHPAPLELITYRFLTFKEGTATAS